MKVCRNLFSLFLAVGMLLAALPSLAQEDVELKVYDPRAVLWAPALHPVAPKLDTLDGKKIAIMSNKKPGGDAIRPFIERHIRERFPNVELKEFPISYNMYPTKNEDMKNLAEWADGVIGIMGD